MSFRVETSSSAHHWARKLAALGLEARIIAAQLVKPDRDDDLQLAAAVRAVLEVDPEDPMEAEVQTRPRRERPKGALRSPGRRVAACAVGR